MKVEAERAIIDYMFAQTFYHQCNIKISCSVFILLDDFKMNCLEKYSRNNHDISRIATTA